jgi:Na+/alanine symporter
VVIVPNLIALILLSGQVARETKSYFEREPWRENEIKHKRLKESGRL